MLQEQNVMMNTYATKIAQRYSLMIFHVSVMNLLNYKENIVFVNKDIINTKIFVLNVKIIRILME